VIYSTLSSDTVRKLVSRQYGIGSGIRCDLYQRGVNDIYLIGQSERRFAFRLSRTQWRDRASIEAELRVLAQLDRRGVSVAEPLARVDGGLITEVRAPEGVRQGVVFRWARGRALSYTDPSDAEKLGRYTAAMHSAGDDLSAIAARPCIDLDYLLSRSLSRLHPRLRGLPKAARRLDALIARLKGHLDSAMTRDLNWGLCHGDLHGDNARICADRITVFDFDFCGSGWRLLDLASYGLEARRQGKVDWVAWRAFIEGYLSLRPTMSESLEFVGLFMILRQLWIAGQCTLLSTDGTIGHLSDEFFENLSPFCEAIERDSENGRYDRGI
jgi:Ser/Thr protein kinase RdoA (MazF antagonist)